MITIFNRKELCVTTSMEKKSKICSVLSDNKVDYTVKTVNRTSSSPLSAGSRGRTGTLGINSDVVYEYIIYVKKEDFDKAVHLMSSKS